MSISKVFACEEGMFRVLGRLAELDAALEMAPGCGIAETVLRDLLQDFERGDFGLITSSWTFDKGIVWARRRLKKVLARWREEHLQIDEELQAALQRQAAVETGGDVRRLLKIFVREGKTAMAEPIPIISLASRSVDAARAKRGGAVERLRGKSQPTNVCALHDSGIEHPARTSVSGGDAKPKPKRKSRHHAR